MCAALELRRGCASADLVERVVDEEFAVAEHWDEEIAFLGQGVGVILCDGTVPRAVVDEEEPSCLGLLPRVRDGILEHVAPGALAVYEDRRTLERILARVPVGVLLEEPTARAERDVVAGPPGNCHRVEDPLKHDGVDAIALDHTDVRVQDLVPLRVGRRPERAAEDLEHARNHDDRVAGVGTDDERPITSEHLLAKLATPQALTRAVDIERVRHDRDEPRRELLEHVLEREPFVGAAPRRNRRMLRRRNRKARHPRAVDVARQQERGHRVRPLEVDEMRGPTDR